ncbi:MAG: DUF531 domain-containing protein [Euryarchaeota archaeon]|nr:DUF531 domain-containing protein [Euryarchaeota archaeon]
MSPGAHGPTELRELLRRLKEQRSDPHPLIRDAKLMADRARAAEALVAIATHAEATTETRNEALEVAVDRIRQVEREGQVAETVPVIVKTLDNAGAATAAAPFVDRLTALPDGEALSVGLRETAKHVPDPLRVALFERALLNRGTERDDAKAVLRAAFTTPADLETAGAWQARLRAIDDPELSARLMAFLHHQIATIASTHALVESTMADVAQRLAATTGRSDARGRIDLWRAIVQTLVVPSSLDPLERAIETEPPGVRADVALALGAQADRLGEKERASALFDDVERLVAEVPPTHADRLLGKLETARAYLRGETPGGKKGAPEKRSKPVPMQRQSGRLTAPSGHSLALLNTYTGGVKEIHFRAVARAAPLCAAFGLDLVLVGFPLPLTELVERTARETRIGGHPWVVDLAKARRVHALPMDPGEEPAAWRARGTWVAATEKPDPTRRIAIEEQVHAGPVCVIMGIGPKGLPNRVKNACAGEYEITGAEVGLETATAMGILADRLGKAGRAAGRGS